LDLSALVGSLPITMFCTGETGATDGADVVGLLGAPLFSAWTIASLSAAEESTSFEGSALVLVSDFDS